MVRSQVKPAEVVRRRRAVYSSLHGILSEQELIEALALYEQEFLLNKVFTATAFVKRLADVLLLGEKQEAIHPRLVKALMLPEEQLHPDPLQRTPEAAHDPTVTTPPSSPTSDAASLAAEAAVFGTLVQSVCEQLRRHDAQRLTTLGSDIEHEMSALKLPKPIQAEVRAWSAQCEAPPGRVAMQPESMKEAVQLLYVWSCKAFGPTLTDKVFGVALRQSEQLPQASVFSPRQLL